LCAFCKTISGILRQTFYPISYRYSFNIFQDHTSSIHESFPSSTNGYNYYTLSWATASITTEAVVPSTLCYMVTPTTPETPLPCILRQKLDFVCLRKTICGIL